MDAKKRKIQTELDGILHQLNLISKDIGDLFKQGLQKDAIILKEKTVLLKEKSKELAEKADVLAKSLDQNKIEGERVIYLSPKGKKFDQNYARELSNEKSVSFICGHFEGVDERVLSTRNIEEISIGDYILSGGETAAFVMIDSILRLLPGVLGNENSRVDESFDNGLLEYPQYTKPQIWEEKSVPEVLLSGDHNKIKDWRLSQSEAITRVRRPDLWEKYKKN